MMRLTSALLALVLASSEAFELGSRVEFALEKKGKGKKGKGKKGKRGSKG